MSIEMNTVSQDGADVIEAGHWAPPSAPLDMPAQVLERVAARTSMASVVSRFWHALMPRLRA